MLYYIIPVLSPLSHYFSFPNPSHCPISPRLSKKYSQWDGRLQNINLHMKGESETASQLGGQRHPLQTISEITICRLSESMVNRKEEDIDTLLQNKYNTEERKLIIVDRTKGKIIDSRVVDIQQEINDPLQQSFFIPVSLRSQSDQYVYEFIGSAYDAPSQGGGGKGKSIWEQSWRQYEKVHQSFLQSILKNQPLQFINHLQKKMSQLPIDINYRYQSNWAPLHYAAMHSSIQIISRLINDPRIDVNALTDFQETPLHIAAKANKLENCLLLMSAGVCIDKRDCDQNTALHYATEYGYRDIAKALLENGASPLIKNCTGMAAIDLASANLADLFKKYKEEQEQQQDRMYRNRNNHRNMIEKMLALNYQEAPPKEGQSQCGPQGQGVAVQGGQGRDARFFRKQHIFKLYQFIRENQRMETITLSSFKFYKKIGEGAFGEVYLVRKDKQENFLALKAIRKERVYGTNLYRYIQTEKDILSLLNHPFIVRLRYAFQTETYLFLAMDYCEGGDLSRLLEKRKKFTEQQVRNYACEILLGLEALHKHGIIYRDLKPENIVLDRDGHALITDFGLSKKTDNLDAINKSFCGTPAYLPLEIINKKGHTRMADWYEYGVVLYELFTGCPPYYADTKQELYDLVRKGVIRFTKNTPELFKDLVKKLLSQNPEKRLGFEKDAESIREHPWFADVDWEQVIERKLEMPAIENKLKIGQPIKTKFHDVRSEKFQIPMWSFME